MTTPLIDVVEQFEAETRDPEWRYFTLATWTLLLLGGYLRFDRELLVIGRLLVASALLMTLVTAGQMLVRLFRSVVPLVRDRDSRAATDAWDRDRRISAWRHTQAAGATHTILRGGIKRARTWTFLAYAVIVLLPGTQFLPVVDRVPLFLRWLVLLGAGALLLGMLAATYRWRQMSRAWAQYYATQNRAAS